MTDLKPEDLERVERLLARAIVAANSSAPVETHLGLACEFIGAREDFLSLLADRARMEKALREALIMRVGEAEVGRYIYRRIERLMDAKPGTVEGAELCYLAEIAEGVEEYGEQACDGHPLGRFPPPSPEMGEISREAAKRSSERLNSFVSSTISKAQAATGDTEGGAGWLVEGWNARTGEFKACWWGLGDAFEEGFGWTTDSTKALRFARETDAQKYIVEAGWTDAKPTEHAWGSVHPSPADYLGKVIESAISESLSGDWEAARDAAVTLILSKLKENGLSREGLA